MLNIFRISVSHLQFRLQAQMNITVLYHFVFLVEWSSKISVTRELENNVNLWMRQPKVREITPKTPYRQWSKGDQQKGLSTILIKLKTQVPRVFVHWGLYWGGHENFITPRVIWVLSIKNCILSAQTKKKKKEIFYYCWFSRLKAVQSGLNIRRDVEDMN